MKKLLLIIIIYTSFCNGGDLFVKPFETGVTNFTYTEPFWLVSPPSFSLLLSTYYTSTNYHNIIEEKDKIIVNLLSISNIDNRYMQVLELENKTLRKELNKARSQIFWWTAGGVIFSVGFTALIYHLAGSHIKAINE